MKNKNKIMPLYSGRLQANYRVPTPQNASQSTGLLTFIGGSLHGAFVVKAPDDTMQEAGIQKGDALLIKPNLRPSNGSIVLASMNGKQIIRHFIKRGDRLSLRAADRTQPDILIHSQQKIVIEGLVDRAFC